MPPPIAPTEPSPFSSGPTVDEEPEIIDRPMRLRRFDPADFGYLAGAAVSAFCLDWLLYERFTPLSGGLGFFAVWYVFFLATYFLIVRDQRGKMAARDRVAGVVIASCAILVVSALLLIVGYTIFRGLAALRPHFFTQTQQYVGPLSPASQGGAAHAIVATLEVVAIASIFSVPLGITTALFLNEVGGVLARPLRLIIDAMSAIPSIVAGLFIYAVWILQLHQPPSGFAGAMALSVLFLPTVTRTSELVLRLVPGGLREGALALGSSEWRMARNVTLPTARSGLVTAVILGIARTIGETAPLLLVAGGGYVMEWNPLHKQEPLPLFTYNLIRFPQKAQIERAWTGAMVLLFLVLFLFAIARIIGSRKPGQEGFIRRRLNRRHATA